MDISSITSQSTTPITDSLNQSQELNSQEFLELLTVQMSNQDPLNPMSDTDMLAQMAQFSSLESMNSLVTQFTQFTEDQKTMSANAYLGKEITVLDQFGAEHTGRATSLDYINGQLYISVNDELYSISQIQRVALSEVNNT